MYIRIIHVRAHAHRYVCYMYICYSLYCCSDPRPPSIFEVVSNENNITIMGNYSSGKCYGQEDSRFEYSFEFNVNSMGQGSANVSSLNYTFPARRGENYTISVTAIVTVNGVQLKSQPFSFSMIAGEEFRMNIHCWPIPFTRVCVPS